MRFVFLYCLFVSIFFGYVFESPAFGMDSDASEAQIFKVIRVIVAEDSETIRKVYVRYLCAPQYTLTLVDNGAKLLEQYLPGRFDLIITDGSMPEMDGYEAVKQLIKRYGKQNLPPIIAVTSNDSVEKMKEFLEAGADGFVPKPIVRRFLFAEINRFLRSAENRIAPVSSELEVIKRFESFNISSSPQ